MKNIAIVKYFLALFLISLPIGCGYTLQGSGTILPPDIKNVAIDPVENDTTEPGLGPRLREALRSRFEQYGVVKVVDRSDRADAVLATKVLSVESRVRNVTGATDVAVDLDLIMTVSSELKRRNGEILWRDPSFQVDQPFANTGEIVVTQSSGFAEGNIGADTLQSLDALQVSQGQKDQAFSDLIEETARQIYFESVAADF